MVTQRWSLKLSILLIYRCGLTENDGHEIGGQDIYRLKIDYITMQCAVLFKTTAEYKSQQRCKLYRPCNCRIIERHIQVLKRNYTVSQKKHVTTFSAIT